MVSSLLRNFRTGAQRPYFSLPQLSAPASVLSGLSVPGRLRLAAAESATGFQFGVLPEAALPRRVQAGEAIARDPRGFPLLAPVPGIIDYEPETQTFTLKTEGAVKFGASVPTGEDTPGPIVELQDVGDAAQLRLDFLKSLLQSGVPSLDFRGLSLNALFARALEQDHVRVVVSRRDGDGGLDWSRIFAAREAQIHRLIEFFGRLHGRLTCTLGPRGASGPEVYGETLPRVLIQRLPAVPGFPETIDPERELAEQGIVFLGPATLFALLDWMFEGRPFTDRLTVIRSVDSKNSQLFRLINGYDLQLLFQEKLPDAKLRAKRVVVAGNLIQHPPRDFSDPALQTQNIFGSVNFQILREDALPTRGAQLPCTLCMACEQICPVDAGPFALLEGRPEEFRARECLECGLCDFVCESGIRISDEIAARRVQIRSA